jgi:hypothetical protein
MVRVALAVLAATTACVASGGACASQQPFHYLSLGDSTTVSLPSFVAIVNGPASVRTFWRWRRIIFVDLKQLTLHTALADVATEDGRPPRARANISARVVSPINAATRVVDYSRATCQLRRRRSAASSGNAHRQISPTGAMAQAGARWTKA